MDTVADAQCKCGRKDRGASDCPYAHRVLPEILGYVCCQIKNAGPHLQRSVSVRVQPERCWLWTSETLWFWERMRKMRGSDRLGHRTLSLSRGAMVFVAFLGAVTEHQTEII